LYFTLIFISEPWSRKTKLLAFSFAAHEGW